VTVRTSELERGAGVARSAVNLALAPWGGSEACLERYETGIRLAMELQLSLARFVRFEPVRSLASTSASMTRDVGAAQLSVARWFLDD
jgi:hypothetical protein